MLTREQYDVLRQLSRESAGRSPTARLMSLADEWHVEFVALARAYSDVSAPNANTPHHRQISQSLHQPNQSSFAGNNTPRQPLPSSDSGVRPIRPVDPLAESPVGHIRAREGDITVLPRNWVVMKARLDREMSLTDVARYVGMSSGDYRKLEEGRLLPTADQAARIVALFGLKMDESFVAASQDIPLGRGSQIRGFSVLGILRSRKRMNYKELAEAVTLQTGEVVTSACLGAVEKGDTVRMESPHFQRMIIAVAKYFGVPADFIKQSMPAELIDLVAQNTKVLHQTLKQTQTMNAAKLQALEEPTQLLSKGKE